ncbi:cytochrome c1 [Sphingomonas sp. AOB5]|uniref:cytochrome c1 n=1 Tax=Sphingomonas sp. AOB5 TaxID=3034017 RepID=UPI0023F7AB4C|nr:cytochrome c1 [Sphingomonas sp. AOB5]MDF7775061.1 cytochrome c1 [Sphingomonas sp. AOB5]
MLPLFVRSIKFLVGLAFVGVLAWSLLWTVVGLWTEPAQPTAEHEFHKHPEKVQFASDGVFGKFDKAQLQRGYKVYEEVCAACHSLSMVSFRELADLGYNEAQVKNLAKKFDDHAKQPTYNPVSGDRGERGNLPSDRFPHIPYAGAGVPPDLSLITKARHNGGAYVYSLLTGYQAQPKELLEKFPGSKTPDGLFYNPYFANLNLSMPAPLTSDGQVTYDDGTPATVKQMAKDVSAFLIWSAEPTAQKRKEVGWAVVLFLLITTLLAYGAYRSVWAGVKH